MNVQANSTDTEGWLSLQLLVRCICTVDIHTVGNTMILEMSVDVHVSWHLYQDLQSLSSGEGANS